MTTEISRKICRGEILTPWTIAPQTYLVVIIDGGFLAVEGGVATDCQRIAFFDTTPAAVVAAKDVGGEVNNFELKAAKAAWISSGFPRNIGFCWR